ncbi:sugar ABC transporter substrate-binding protein [Reticulibacter mediterranei]|uniref:Sugar ABC transporter substrate-binding protein n=1 Tax=Reticulibacter mediterranei TaxID=2778369 RepID=A0A8J3MZQ4_9CHLR|nr:sugar ABC transporter substrate-binding protein [Reticulibacter mediterranei]GHO90460.1 sugar ABC transporter substrate-binding protein [Reticulibacter mediterranei]
MKQLSQALIAIFTTGCLLLVITGCGGTSVQNSAQPYQGVHLTFSRWAGPDANAMAKVLPEFTKETGIQVTMDAISYDNLQQKQILDFTSHTANYDVLWVPEVWLPQYAQSGWLQPLQQYSNDPSLTPANFDLNDFMPSVLQTGKYNGTLYALPSFVQTPILVYRKDLLQSAHLPVPATWNDALKDAQYFKQHGMGGIAMPAKSSADGTDVWASFMRSAGGDYFNAQGVSTVNSSAGVAALQYWSDLLKTGPTGSLQWEWDDVNANLLHGNVAMGITISGIANQFVDPSQTKFSSDFGYLALPYKDQLSGTLASWSWAMNKDSKNPKAAYLLISYLTSKRVAQQLGELDATISARASLFTASGLVAKQPWLPAVQDALKNGKTQPLIPGSAKISQIMQRQIALVSSGNLSSQTALNQAQQQITQAMKS